MAGGDSLIIVIIRTLIVYFALLLSMRLMGKRQLSELELPELAVAVLIADLGAHPLQDIGIPLLNGLLPIAVLFCCEVLISGAAMCSPRLRSALFGRPGFLIEDGQINQHEMRRSRVTPDELMEQLRSKDITDLRQVQYAVLETDGEIKRRALSGAPPGDGGGPRHLAGERRLRRHRRQRRARHGRQPRYLGRDAGWLSLELRRRGISSAKEAYLAVADRTP